MIVDGLQKVCSENARGKFSFSGGFGKLQFSYNRFGHYTEFAGIYCKYKKNDKIYTLKKKFYRPTNPNSPAQQWYRNWFKQAHEIWRTTPPEYRQIWIDEGKKLRMTGLNYLIHIMPH